MFEEPFDLFAPLPIELFEQAEIGKAVNLITAERPGRVEFAYTRWRARFYYPNTQSMVGPNTLVSVVGRQGNTLLVLPFLKNHLSTDLQTQSAC